MADELELTKPADRRGDPDRAVSPPAKPEVPEQRGPDPSTGASDEEELQLAASHNAGDGRRLRRERNRTAVVDALLDLYTEGNLAPSTEEITRRAGLSSRSLFRYFDDVDDLAGTAITQAHARVAPLAALDARPDDPLADRIAALADQRCALFEAVESVALVTRLRAPFSLVVAQNLAAARAFLRSQVADQFAPELGAMTKDLATSRLAALDVICSFESYRLLRDDQALERGEARRAIIQSLTDLLRAGPPADLAEPTDRNDRNRNDRNRNEA